MTTDTTTTAKLFSSLVRGADKEELADMLLRISGALEHDVPGSTELKGSVLTVNLKAIRS